MINKFKSQATQIFRTHSLPRWLVFVIDNATVLFSFLFAYLLRFNLVMKAFSFTQAFQQALFVLFVYAIIMIILKSYAGLIRQTTIRDTFIIILTTTISSAIIFVLSLLD